MKNTVTKFFIIVLLALLVGGAVSTQAKGRKLPAGSYITSAKIEILSGDEVRYDNAIALLDSLFMHYGPHAEGLYWMAQIQVDLIGRRSNLKEKLPYVEAMVKYIDSVHWTCDNKEIKKKYREDCKKFTKDLDSTRVLFWRTFYNDGVSQINEVESLMEVVKEETDSTALAFYETRLEAMIDSCKDNMMLAVAIDSTDGQPYIGLGSVYEKTKKFKESNEWFKRALGKTGDDNQVLLQIAYNYIQMNDYCEGIPYFREYVDNATANEALMADPDNVSRVMSTMFNLSICYNNCKQYDSAYAIYQRMLKYDPENVQVLTGAGRYHSQMARLASDSANYYTSAGNEEKKEYWREVTSQQFDSARVFLKESSDLQPDNASAAEEYGVICAIIQKFDEAATAFERAVVLDPGRADNWTSLGDCYLSLADFEKAATAYEKTVEIRPNDKDIWLHLKDLYTELGNKQRLAEVEAKLKEL